MAGWGPTGEFLEHLNDIIIPREVRLPQEILPLLPAQHSGEFNCRGVPDDFEAQVTYGNRQHYRASFRFQNMRDGRERLTITPKGIENTGNLLRPTVLE
jgi:hypothetical protein